MFFEGGVLRPVPEQSPRISLTRVQSPLRTLQHPAQLVFLHTRREQLHPGYPTMSSFTTEGNNTLDTTRSSFTTEGNNTERMNEIQAPRSSF
ncbi:hypothetical protein Taro_015204 [Colocasia esculenta]|uniref:Uncharacterized protein n=1 Tax=Colocasia esculenta TaxID=4460 RepID=A0A843UKR1_COLES|nr:hypothetical protein [Colocasia esculenta]